jgi:hypothetical protein
MAIGAISHTSAVLAALRTGVRGGLRATSAVLSVVTGLIVLAVTVPNVAQAADITWGGEYRVEAVKIKNSELTNSLNKGYLLHHLVLTPKIVAADGLTVYSRFDILNNSIFGQNNQAGEVFGKGPHDDGTPATPGQSNSYGRTEASGTLAITELYLSWVQEFGQLVVGRMPLQFGLGTAYNAGNGPFDKYLDTRDLVGYKIVMGNLFVFPMVGKMSQGRLGQEDDVNDYMVHLQYENPESESAAGVFYRVRTAVGHGNDAPVSATDDSAIGGAGATAVGGQKLTQWSLFGTQKFADFKLGLEANIVSGQAGVQTSAANGSASVNLNAFSIAAELNWQPKNSKLDGVLKAGIASGDDPSTADKYEGFIFSRNYDVALLMFNHPLGQANLLRTGVIRDVSGSGAGLPSNQIDTEAISNAVYFAPSLQYHWRENMSFAGTFVYGILNESPVANQTISKSLGEEVDLSFTYKPYERLTWLTEMGMLFPGAAWKAGLNNFATGFAYGVTTRAAISF